MQSFVPRAFQNIAIQSYESKRFNFNFFFIRFRFVIYCFFLEEEDDEEKDVYRIMINLVP